MSRSMRRDCVLATLAFFIPFLHQTASAQTAFGNGDLVVLRVADRTSLGAQSVQIREYATNTTNLGTAIQTIAVPSSATDLNTLTIAGYSDTNGALLGGSLSLNPNRTVTFAGYREISGGPVPTTTPSVDVNRVIGSLDLSTGVVNTNVGLTTAYDMLHFRSVATADGEHFYLAGQSGSALKFPAVQVVTVTGGLPSSVTTIATTTALVAKSNNLNHILIANGNLFVSSGNTVTGRTIHQIGTGLPLTSGQTLSASFPAQTIDAYNSFTLARLGAGTSWNSTGFDTIYAVDNHTAAASTVRKWSFNGTTWSATGSIRVNSANHITIRQNSASSVDLFVTTQTNDGPTLSTIRALTDTSGFGGSLTGSFNTILTGSGNEGFLGIAFVTPVPEPSTVLAISAAAVALIGAMRRRRITSSVVGPP